MRREDCSVFIKRSNIVTICRLLLFLTAAVLLCGCRGREEIRLISPEQGEGTPESREEDAEDHSEREGAALDQEVVSGQEGSADQEGPEGRGRSADQEPDVPGTPDTDEIAVFLCGEVMNGGVYYLPPGSRVCDALEAAGWFTGDADTEWLNLAAFVQDEQQIRVPSREETAPLREQGYGVFGAGGEGTEDPLSASGETDPDGRVNINTAGIETLRTIPGVGPVKAGRIIAYRQEHGNFNSIDELRNIEGIGDASFRNMKDHVTVGEH